MNEISWSMLFDGWGPVVRTLILAAMRQNGFTEPSEVDAVVIETEGSLSILKNHAANSEALNKLGVSIDLAVGQ